MWVGCVVIAGWVVWLIGWILLGCVVILVYGVDMILLFGCGDVICIVLL